MQSNCDVSKARQKTQGYDISEIGARNAEANKTKFLSSRRMHSIGRDKLSTDKQSISTSLFIFIYGYMWCQVQSKKGESDTTLDRAF